MPGGRWRANSVIYCREERDGVIDPDLEEVRRERNKKSRKARFHSVRPAEALLEVDGHGTSAVEAMGAVEGDDAAHAVVTSFAEKDTRAIAELVHRTGFGGSATTFARDLRCSLRASLAE